MRLWFLECLANSRVHPKLDGRTKRLTLTLNPTVLQDCHYFLKTFLGCIMFALSPHEPFRASVPKLIYFEPTDKHFDSFVTSSAWVHEIPWQRLRDFARYVTVEILQKNSKEKNNSDLQWSNNAGFGNGDALLLHGFMDTCAVRIIHLRKSTNKGRKKWRISDLVLRTADKRWTFHEPTINALETRMIFNQSKIKQ